MELADLIKNFITNPCPVWNNELVKGLINCKLTQSGVPYSLTRSILKSEDFPEETVQLYNSPTSIKIVLPSERLDFFYQDHGLEPLAPNECFRALAQVQQALKVFEEIPEIYSFISQIVRSIQLLKPENPETDVSFSHPDIPFSIFVSVCFESHHVSALRLAESILHEAMHLFLTFIEGILPVVNFNSRELFYSPWRDEERPVRGVIHALFVFKSIMDFYRLLSQNSLTYDETKFIDNRVSTIRRELEMLLEFPMSSGLTIMGQRLAINLLK